MSDRLEWLKDVDRCAEALMAEAGFEDRMCGVFRDGQKGKWGQDNLSGYYWYLHALVSVLQPKTVVELGRCLGTSALFMLGALPKDGRLITVDIEERASDLSHCRTDPRLTVVTGNDLDLSIYYGLDMGPIDFLFIDTDHTNAQASKEWSLYLPLLAPDAVVAFDDITMNDMGTFWHGLDCAKLETGTKYHYTGFGLAAP